MNVLDDILNAGENVEDQEDYWFTASFFRIVPTLIDDITKNKLMSVKLGDLRSQRDI